MELVGLVSYEREFECKVAHPKDRSQTIATFWIVHPESQSVVKALRSEDARNAMISAEPEDYHSVVAACAVRRWDWHGNSIRGEEPGELTLEKAVRVFLDPELAFVTSRVRVALNTAENFTDA